MTDEEKKALKCYKDNAWLCLNPKLRAGKELDEEETQLKAHLDSAINKNSYDQEITVYRGFASTTPNEYRVGCEVNFEAYSSTSISQKVACKFLDTNYEEEIPIFLKLKIPSGCSFAWMEVDEAINPDEQEILLPRKTRIRILTRKLIEGYDNILALDGVQKDDLHAIRDGGWEKDSKSLKQVLYLSGEVLLSKELNLTG